MMFGTRLRNVAEEQSEMVREIVRLEVRSLQADLRTEIKAELRTEMMLELAAEMQRMRGVFDRQPERAPRNSGEEPFDVLADVLVAREFMEEPCHMAMGDDDNAAAKSGERGLEPLSQKLGDQVGGASSSSREIRQMSEGIQSILSIPEDGDFEHKDLSQDMWGVAIMLLTRELAEIEAGGYMPSHIIRLVYGSLCVLLNLFLQLAVLRWVTIYIVGNSVWTIQGQYAKFHREVFDKSGEFMQEAWKNWNGPRDELCDAVINKRLFLGCILFLWIGRMLSEFKTCHRMYREIFNLPRAPRGTPFKNCVVHGRQFPQEVEIVAMNRGVLVAIACLVLVPKVSVCLLLATLGCQWLTATLSFSDLILNALALEFIIGIDESILECFLPKRVKGRLESTKLTYVILLEDTVEAEEKAVIDDYKRNILYFCVGVLLTTVYVVYLQQVLPFKNWGDIDEHCGEWYYNQYRPKCSPFELGCFPYGEVDAPHDYGKMQP